MKLSGNHCNGRCDPCRVVSLRVRASSNRMGKRGCGKRKEGDYLNERVFICRKPGLHVTAMSSTSRASAPSILGSLPIIQNYLLGGLSQRLGSISQYDKASLYYPKHSCAGGYFISHGILVRCQAFPSCLSLLKMLVCIQSHQTQCLDCDVGGDWFKWLMWIAVGYMHSAPFSRPFGMCLSTPSYKHL